MSPGAKLGIRDEIIQTVMDTVGAWAHNPAIRDDIAMVLARRF